MKKIITLASLLFAFSVVFAGKPQTEKKSRDQFEIKISEWKNAYNSGNAQNLATLYAEEAVYTSSHVDRLEAVGRDKLITNFQNGMNMGGHIDSIEILSMEISRGLASLYCRYQATNAETTVTGRNLLVLKKINGYWVIVLHMTVV